MKDNTTYYLAARAFDNAGNMSDASATVSFKTPSGIVPALPATPVITGEILTLSNPTETDFSGYRLYVGLKPDLSDAATTYIFPKSGAITPIYLSEYFHTLNTGVLYVRIAAVDANNHEGVPTAILKIDASSVAGDLDHNGNPDLADVILALRMLSCIEVSYIYSQNDINGDGKIGLEEVVYILQKVAGLR